MRLEESAAFAGGEYWTQEVGRNHVTLLVEASLDSAISGREKCNRLRALKTMTFTSSTGNCDARCRIELVRMAEESGSETSSAPLRFMIGLEMVVNLLAPNAPDRYFDIQGTRHALAWSGVVEGSHLRVVDEWQDVAVEIDAPDANQLWVAPIETVSGSEEGFERVYQGSQILGVWTAEIAPGGTWAADAVLHVTPAGETGPAR